MTAANQAPVHSRRSWLAFLGGAAVASLAPRLAAAGPSGVQAQRLRNRLELWQTYARNSDTLIARYHVTRWSSLLREPLVNDGTLACRAGEALVLKDDGFSGARTDIDRATASYGPVASEDPPRRLARAANPSADWLAERWLRIFSKGSGDALIEDARVEVPKGRTPRLELRPLLEHPARMDLRGLTLTLDPVGGAVVRLEIAEAQGDRIRFDFADHRQGVPERELDSLLARPGQ